MKVNPIRFVPRDEMFFGSLAFYLCYIIPVVLFVIFFIIYRKQVKENANIALVRTKKANKTAVKRLKNAGKLLKENKKEEFYDEVLRALWGYLSDKLSIPLANLTKDNVEAELDGEVDSAAKVQYLGNFEPGKSGSIGFVFTPQTAGKTDITLKIQYEDAGQEIHTLTFPLSLDVQDSPVMEGDDMDYLAEEPKSGPGVWPFAAAGAVLLTGAIVFLLLRRRKARKAQLNPEETWEEWDLPQNQEYLGTEHQDEEETTP